MSHNEKQLIFERSRRLCRQFQTKWVRCKRTFERFSRQNVKWLTNYFEMCLNTPKHPVVQSTSSSAPVGRPSLSYHQKSDRSKRRLVSKIVSECDQDPDMLVHAASSAARVSGNSDLAAVLKQMGRIPSLSSKIRKTLSNPQKLPVAYSPDEALSFLLDNNLSKSQYMNMRIGSKERNADIYPPYATILKAKMECRISGFTVSETTAKVPLGNLLDHTVRRIVQLQNSVIEQYLNNKNLTFCEATLVLSYGFDGSSGFSNYNQKFTSNDNERNDSSIFATTVIPLRLIATNTNTILWNNYTPQSIRFCRPLKIEYVKESREHILEEKISLDEEIRCLQHTDIIFSNEKRLRIRFDLHMTLIDGKVLNALTDTKSSQACPICGATPKTFQSTTNFSSPVFKARPHTLQYGISPLHAWIRFFECILHIAYRIELRTWQVRGEAQKITFRQRKLEIQKRFWEQMGLNIDKPKANGSGTTNDGNTSRRAFNQTEKFAEVTDVDEQLIKRFKNILIALACQYPLNPDLFGEYCSETGNLYMKLYDWYPMPASVHKVLIHGKEILLNSILPLGNFGEDAAESRNKFYKKDREMHARKDSRIHNLTDVFNR